MALDRHRMDLIIDKVFYCGINNAITCVGFGGLVLLFYVSICRILGNILLLLIFMRPKLIRHQSILHTYLKVIVWSSYFPQGNIRYYILHNTPW